MTKECYKITGLMQYVVHLVMSCLLFSAIACKVRNSQVLSLTEEELEQCRFDGKRFMGLIGPDFEYELSVYQNIFGQFLSSRLMTESYVQQKFKDNPQKLADCKAVLSSMGKYHIVFSYTNSQATRRQVYNGFKGLREAILSFRRQNPNKPVQVLLAISSHGYKADLAGSEYLVVIAKKEFMKFEEFAQQLYENIISHEEQGTWVHLADELVIMMDNCFSGSFIDAMRGFVSNHNLQANDLKKTLIIGFSASGSNQIADGSLNPVDASSGEPKGLITTALDSALKNWVADSNADGFLSWQELYEYIKSLGSITSIKKATSSLMDLAKNLICPNVQARREAMKRIRDHKNFFDQLFNNPLVTLRSRQENVNDPTDNIRILGPKIYINVDDSARLSQLVFAATYPKQHRNLEELASYEQQVAAIAEDATLIENLTKLVQASYDHILDHFDKYLDGSVENSSPVNIGQLPPPLTFEEQSAFDPTPSKKPSDKTSNSPSRIDPNMVPMGAGSYVSSGSQPPIVPLQELKVDHEQVKRIYQLIRLDCFDSKKPMNDPSLPSSTIGGGI